MTDNVLTAIMLSSANVVTDALMLQQAYLSSAESCLLAQKM